MNDLSKAIQAVADIKNTLSAFTPQLRTAILSAAGESHPARGKAPKRVARKPMAAKPCRMNKEAPAAEPAAVSEPRGQKQSQMLEALENCAGGRSIQFLADAVYGDDGEKSVRAARAMISTLKKQNKICAVSRGMYALVETGE